MAIPWQEVTSKEEYLDLSSYVEDPARVVPQTNLMKAIGPSIWLVESPPPPSPSTEGPRASFCSTIFKKHTPRTALPWEWQSQAVGPVTTVIVGLRGGGGAWVWNPQVPLTHELQTEIQARCGGVRHIVCPNRLRLVSTYSFLQEWSAAYPNAKLYAPSDYNMEDIMGDLDEEEEYVEVYDDQNKVCACGKGGDCVCAIKYCDLCQAETSVCRCPHHGESEKDSSRTQKKMLNFDFILTEDVKRDFVLDMDQVLFRGSRVDEAVFYHRLSRTVLFADLMQGTPEVWHTETTNRSSRSFGVSWMNLFDRRPPGAPLPPNDNDNTSTRQQKYCTPYEWQVSFFEKEHPELASKALHKIMERWKPHQIVLAQGTHVLDDSISAEHAPEQELGNTPAMGAMENVFEWIPPVVESTLQENLYAIPKEELGGFQRGSFTTGESIATTDDSSDDQ